MGKYKICVYAICKNEEKYVDRWMDSMGEADLVVVTDTGSEDATVEKLRARGALVFEDKVSPWRFDTARNLSLSHVPVDADICVCTDLDELFIAGWREKLEKAWKESEPPDGRELARTGKYVYNWSLKPDGSPDVQFMYSKAHSRRDFLWRWPVHEYLQYIGTAPHLDVFIDGMVLNHYPDPEKSRGSYLPLLEMAVREAPADERMRYYLGREYMYKGRWESCVETLRAYLDLPTAKWNEERCAAMRWIAKSCFELGRTKDACGWYYRAIAEAPHTREPYVEFAQICYTQSDWPMALFLTEAALKISDKSPTYINMGYAWDHTPDDLCAIAAYNMGLMEKALLHAVRALKHSPNDERLKRNILCIKNAISQDSRS